MRIWVISDLHNDANLEPFAPPTIPDADLAVVAGDVGAGLVESVAWVADTIGRHMPVIMVAGNHEFYGRAFQDEFADLRAVASRTGVRLLEDETITVGGVAFHGCTLWTDYELGGAANRLPAMEAARRLMMDHRLIRWRVEGRVGRFGPEEAFALHLASRRWLTRALLTGSETATRQVVVTHHAPAPGSVAPRFAGNPLNPAFVSDLGGLIAQAGPALWVHGHTHSSLDYRVSGTRVVCNPRGYGRENPRFDPGLVVEV